MSNKRNDSVFTAVLHRLSTGFHQGQKAFLRFIGQLGQDLYLFEALQRNSRPIPITIRAEPDKMERVEVKIRW